MSKQAIYIAGPMKGVLLLNYPAFLDAAKAWRAAGWYVECPAENDDGLTVEEYSHEGFQQVLSCDAIALLPGWENSVGAKAELHVAQLCGMRVYDAITFEQLLKCPKIRTYVDSTEQFV